jgi:hypothetical protein
MPRAVEQMLSYAVWPPAGNYPGCFADAELSRLRGDVLKEASLEVNASSKSLSQKAQVGVSDMSIRGSM